MSNLQLATMPDWGNHLKHAIKKSAEFNKSLTLMLNDFRYTYKTEKDADRHDIHIKKILAIVLLSENEMTDLRAKTKNDKKAIDKKATVKKKILKWFDRVKKVVYNDVASTSNAVEFVEFLYMANNNNNTKRLKNNAKVQSQINTYNIHYVHFYYNRLLNCTLKLVKIQKNVTMASNLVARDEKLMNKLRQRQKLMLYNRTRKEKWGKTSQKTTRYTQS